MQQLQHICGKVVSVEAFQSHGETILYVEDPATGQQIERCPECEELVIEEMLFDLDFIPEVWAEMAEMIMEEA